MGGFYFIYDLSLPSISFVALNMFSSPLGVVFGEEKKDFESDLVIGAKKKSLLRRLVNPFTVMVVVAECGLLLAWGRGVPLQ